MPRRSMSRQYSLISRRSFTSQASRRQTAAGQQHAHPPGSEGGVAPKAGSATALKGQEKEEAKTSQQKQGQVEDPTTGESDAKPNFGGKGIPLTPVPKSPFDAWVAESHPESSKKPNQMGVGVYKICLHSTDFAPGAAPVAVAGAVSCSPAVASSALLPKLSSTSSL